MVSCRFSSDGPRAAPQFHGAAPPIRARWSQALEQRCRTPDAEPIPRWFRHLGTSEHGISWIATREATDRSCSGSHGPAQGRTGSSRIKSVTMMPLDATNVAMLDGLSWQASNYYDPDTGAWSVTNTFGDQILPTRIRAWALAGYADTRMQLSDLTGDCVLASPGRGVRDRHAGEPKLLGASRTPEGYAASFRPRAPSAGLGAASSTAVSTHPEGSSL